MFFSFPVLAQTASGVVADGRATREKIMLRWSVTDPLAWEYAREYGFIIEKSTIISGGQVVRDRVRKVLTGEPLKPALLPEWEAYIDDDYVAVAAQSIYGETFEMEQNVSSMMKLINRAREQENRFSFLMFACDQSVTAARLSGLYFEDEEVYNGEKYLYRIYANVPGATYAMDTGKVFIGLEDYHPLPAPQDVQVTFEDQVAVVSWNCSMHSRYYNSFWIERSEDGGRTFQRINDKPFITTVQTEGSLDERAYKADSLTANNTEYHYRVVGISSFGELSTPSDTVNGQGRPAFNHAPAIESHEILDSGGVLLKWRFPEAYRGLVAAFALVRQSADRSMQERIFENLPANTREVMDKTPHSSNYYVIEASDQYGRTVLSLPYLVQLEDSIPPAIPVNLRGAVDTTGLVSITWDPNGEPDLYGYSVYKSNFADGEFVQVSGDLLTDHEFQEKISIKDLSEHIFYRVRAHDSHYNPSGFSAVLKLAKPDVIPPVSPVFKTIAVDSVGILVEFAASPSTDVVQHLLYRRAAEEPDWTLVKMMASGDFQPFYHDTSVEHDRLYAYTLIAVDDAGLESQPGVPVTARCHKSSPYLEVESLEYTLFKEKQEIVVRWSYAGTGVSGFVVYRSSDGEHFSQYREVGPDVYSFKDAYKAGTGQVSYRIMARMANGEVSKMSKKVTVKLQER